MSYKVPQNVDRDDQLLPFMTMKQFGILSGGGLFCYMLFTVLSQHFYIEVWGIIVFIPAVLTLCIAYVTIGGLSFTKWGLLFLEKILVPQKRIWNHSFTHTQKLKSFFFLSETPQKKEEATGGLKMNTSFIELVQKSQGKQIQTVIENSEEFLEEDHEILSRLQNFTQKS
jgi:hypothetical protein